MISIFIFLFYQPRPYRHQLLTAVKSLDSTLEKRYPYHVFDKRAQQDVFTV